MKNKKDEKFDCSLCSGICCVTPPTLITIEEIEQSIEYQKDGRCDVLAATIDGSKYRVFVSKRGGMCPFLDNDGKCEIYDDRFSICKSYECQSMGAPIDVFKEDGLNVTPKDHVDNTFNSTFEKSAIDSFNIKIVSVDEAIERTVTTDPNTVSGFMSRMKV